MAGSVSMLLVREPASPICTDPSLMSTDDYFRIQIVDAGPVLSPVCDMITSRDVRREAQSRVAAGVADAYCRAYDLVRFCSVSAVMMLC
jgi:hypothetical protein